MPNSKAPAASPAKQLAGFMAKYDPAIAKLAKAVRAKLRKRMPTAVEMIYDNYQSLVLGFSPNDHPADAIFSVVLMPEWVTICFIQGVKLADPKKLLRGGGNQVRHTRLASAADLDAPYLRGLLEQAIRVSPVQFPRTGKGTTVVRAIAAKQRPRRPKASRA